MNFAKILKKVIKTGYYVVYCDGMQYASSEEAALRLVDSLDKIGFDAAVYHYRDGSFYRCRVVDIERLINQGSA